MTRLDISPSLSLPLDAVTETFAILAVKRAGKSNAAVVLAEEMYDAAVPWVAIDPKGDWWGVRAAGNGNEKGLAVLVFGGLHGDVPLEPTAGRLVADLVVEQRITCVLDVSEMSKADQRRFLIDFADRLYRTNTEPLHVFCEEADEYIPQRVMGENAKLVGVFETLVKRGGFRGIGITLITQRSASLNKDVLTQAGTLFAMRTPSAQDRKAVAAWVDFHATSREMLAELPTLAAGEAWVFSPEWLNTVEKITFRRRRTFDSGATPKVGETRRTPPNLADVDLAAIKEQMAETIERAKADDPKHLRAEIVALKKELARVAVERPEPERVEVPVLTDADRQVLEVLGFDLRQHGLKLTEANDILTRALGLAELPAGAKEGSGSPATAVLPTPPAQELSAGTPTEKAPRRAVGTPPPGEAPPLAKAERAILTAVVQRPGSTPNIVGFLSQYSPKSSSFSNALGRLRTLGLLAQGRPLRPLDGAEAALGTVDPLPSGAELREFWLSRLGKAERALLEVLIDSHPAEVDRDDLAARSGYSASSSSFSNALGRLRTLELCEKGRRRATDELMTAIG